MTTVRLDSVTEATLKRLATHRGQTKSEVIRDAIARLGDDEPADGSAFQRLQVWVGIADSDGRQLSTDTGRRFAEQLQERRRAGSPG